MSVYTLLCSLDNGSGSMFSRQKICTKEAELCDELFTMRCLSYLVLGMLCKERRRVHCFRPSGS
jgi:hypothetical protein